MVGIFSQQLIWRSSGGAWQSHLYCYLTLIKWVHHIAQQSPENPADHRHSEKILTIQVDESVKVFDVGSSFKICLPRVVGLYSGLWLWLRGNDYSVSIFNAATAWHRYNRVMDQPVLPSPHQRWTKEIKIISHHIFEMGAQKNYWGTFKASICSCVFFATHIIKIKIRK